MEQISRVDADESELLIWLISEALLKRIPR
jgi:hypothetical protein